MLVFKDQDTLLEQSIILLEQSCLHSRPQVSTLTYFNRIAISMLKATNIYSILSKTTHNILYQGRNLQQQIKCFHLSPLPS